MVIADDMQVSESALKLDSKEMEGLSKIGVFEDFIKKAEENGVRFRTLADFAEDSEPEQCRIIMGSLTGRAGTLALQEDDQKWTG